MQNNSQTYERQILPGTKAGSTCSQEVFPASRFQLPENKKEPKMTAICGPKCSELFGLFDPVGSWARTFTGLLVGRTGWYSNRCALTWKRKVTKSSRMYFQLAVSALHTKGTGHGLLLKTPSAFDATVSSPKKNPKSGDSGSLAQEIMCGYAERRGLLPTAQTQGLKMCENGKTKFYPVGLLPTPNASEAAKYAKTYNPDSQMGRGLTALAVNGLLLTPKVQDCRHAKRDRGKSNLGEEMSELVYRQTGETSQLNPLFVEEMMGFPTGWILTPFLKESQHPGEPKPTTGGGSRPSKPTETP